MQRHSLVLIAAFGACSEPIGPVPPTWQGTYLFDDKNAHSSQDRDMVGTAFRLEDQRLVFEGQPARPFFQDVPSEWSVIAWELNPSGLATVELRSGDYGIGLGFIGEPAGAPETIDVSFTFTVRDSSGEHLNVRGGQFQHRDAR